MSVSDKAALLVMDFQEEIVGAIAAGGSEAAVAAAAQALAAARKNKIPVIFVKVEYRPSYVEVSPRNKRVSMLKGAGRLQAGTDATRIVKLLEPLDDEPVVIKRRVNAFAHTELRAVLNGLGADTLYLAGLATAGVILSTVRAAADDDYRIFVLSDACADPDPEVQSVLMNKVFPMQSEVITVHDFVGDLEKA